jgi:site-specific DNA-methyltransferase (adenine-specific)
MNSRPPTPEGLKPKELVGIPWKLAFALQASGWYLRSDVIWRKPNAMPESVKDRPTRSHEYVFLLTKAEQYFYDTLAVREQNGRNVRSVGYLHRSLTRCSFCDLPTKLVDQCMLLTSKPGDAVLDPFFGSGTVGVVAIQNQRSFLGIELNPAYVNVAKRRIGKAHTIFQQIEEVG